eukprot:TRINITY_DN10092_c0_g1_i1.p1 TRINITY_DN10092_c0_g1~~TRINITY_DN10092_c0_g1_i1.p1  ORF type:complete len:199 (+),score=26.57 TRINITY_DN10092_c0_g1_i1:238-834(+)
MTVEPLLKTVKLFPNKHSIGSLELDWSDGTKKTLTYPWLRDHCMCASCYHPQTLQRLVDTFNIPLDIKPFATEIDADSNALVIFWASTDGEEQHRSHYTSEFLRSGTLAPYFRSPPVPRLWGSEIVECLPEISYAEVVSGGHAAMLRLVRSIFEHGFAFVRGVPQSSQDTEALLRRIGHVRHTIYGGFWEFTPNLAVS